jgi:hypothetical protein
MILHSDHQALIIMMVHFLILNTCLLEMENHNQRKFRKIKVRKNKLLDL